MKRAPIKLLPSAAHLRRWFSYDPLTGILRWNRVASNSQANRRRNSLFAGQPAGYVSGGYRSVMLNERTFLVHRVIWKMMTGRDPLTQIDHINGDPLDNRWENLRAATQDQNQANRKTSRNNTSGFKGVSFIQAHQKWRAAISVNGKKRHIGYYSTPERAFDAYVETARSMKGAFARTA